MWSYKICRTRDGKPLADVFPSKATWNRVFNRAGSGASATFQLADPLNAPLVGSTLLGVDGTRTLVTSWNGTVRDAKLIVDDDLDFATQELTVGLKDIWTVFEDRYPFGVTSYWADEPNKLPGKLVVASLEWRSILTRVMQGSLVGPFDMWSLPIVLPPIIAGTHGATYENFNFPNTAKILDDISSTENGPDIDFIPRWSPTTGWLEWVMVTGTDAAPRIIGAALDFNMEVANPGLIKVNRRRDGNAVKTGAFGVGAGSNRDMAVYGFGSGELGDTTSVARDVKLPSKNTYDLVELSAMVRAQVAANSKPTEQWSFQFLADGDSGRDLGNVRLGAMVKLLKNGNPHMTSDVNLRVIGLSGDMSNVITPALQQIGGV